MLPTLAVNSQMTAYPYTSLRQRPQKVVEVSPTIRPQSGHLSPPDNGCVLWLGKMIQATCRQPCS